MKRITECQFSFKFYNFNVLDDFIKVCSHKNESEEDKSPKEVEFNGEKEFGTSTTRSCTTLRHCGDLTATADDQRNKGGRVGEGKGTVRRLMKANSGPTIARTRALTSVRT